MALSTKPAVIVGTAAVVAGVAVGALLERANEPPHLGDPLVLPVGATPTQLPAQLPTVKPTPRRPTPPPVDAREDDGPEADSDDTRRGEVDDEPGRVDPGDDAADDRGGDDGRERRQPSSRDDDPADRSDRDDDADGDG